MKKAGLVAKVFAIYVIGVIFVSLLIFLPAWTLNFWQGWNFIIMLFVPMFFVGLYMLIYDRKLLEKRINAKEERDTQKWIQLTNNILFIAAIIIPGLDHRFGWSNVPVWLVFAADILMLMGYLSFIRTMIYNQYASRIIELQKGQKIISTGPYAIVRHPMYSAGIFMYMFMPIVLGSYWALIPILFFPVTIIIRIIDEEKALVKGLKGYKQYMKKVKYRLIPWVW